MLTSPFFRRLFLAYLLLIWAGIAAVAVLGALRLRSSYLENDRLLLATSCRLVARLVGPSVNQSDFVGTQAQIKRLGGEIGCRITLIDSTGKVIADNEADPAQMDNHLGRPEVIDAAARGQGDSIRRSDTVHADLFYFAHRFTLDNGQACYVRLALHLTELHEHLNGLYTASAITAILAMVASAGVSFYLARRHAEPLVQLNGFAHALAHGDLNSRILRPPQDEMGELAESLNAMADSLSALLTQTAKDKSELSAILESMTEGVIAANDKQQILLVNTAASKMLGLAQGQALGKHLWEVFRDQQLLKGLEQMSQQRRTEPILISSGSRKLRVAITVFPAKGDPEGLVMMIHDITESTRYEDLRKEFVANVSHELRTPLTMVRGFIETLADGAMHDPEKGPRYLGLVQKHSEQLANLVNDLLDISKLEGQPGLPSPQSVDIGSIAQKAVDLLSPAAARKQQHVEVKVSSHVPPVVGDPDYLERAVSNLLDNAIKYTPDKGQIHVTVRTEESQVIVEVRDTGMGIPAADLGRIFERFYRVDRSRSREMGGTGLGLSIVKHVAQVHGGKVEVESEPGQGSVFRLRIPAVPESSR